MEYKEEKALLDARSSKMSFYRALACALVIGALVYNFSNGQSMYSMVALVVSVIIFAILVYKHIKIKREVDRISCKIIISERYVARLNGEWTSFKKDGAKFADDENPYTSDLDIFGRKSLFQFINETNTFLGEQHLKKMLAPSEINVDEILKRQEAIKELSELNAFCENIKCEGLLSGGASKDPEKLIEFLESDNRIFKNSKLKYILSVTSVVTAFLPILFFMNPSQTKFTILLGLVLMNCALYLFNLPKILSVLNEINHFKNSINNFRAMLILIEKENFSSELNNELKKNLESEKLASEHIKKLERISDAIDLRYNSLLFIFLNVLLLWDIHCIFALEDLRDEGGNNIKKWLETIGSFEALISLAVLPEMNKDWNFPSFSGNKLEIHAKDVGHPLINKDVRVYNNFSLKNIAIISGSNMAGKTTFLRTLGINLTLAYAGAPVCASSFKTPILDIYTSMRIKDDLNENISTFYAELIRIKKIINNSNSRKPMIFLIDEIFRGTNSYDRVFGSEKVLLQLQKPWIIGAISTHDLEVCRLEESDDKFTNYHFSEQYINNEIEFDYTIKDGVSTTRNARHLMKMVGIET